MPPWLKDSLITYVDECKVLIRERYYEGCNKMLSPTLRGEVANHNHGFWLRNVTFFACDDSKERSRFTVAIAGQLTMAIYGKAEVIVAVGEPAAQLHIIVKGVVARTNGVILCTGEQLRDSHRLAA